MTHTSTGQPEALRLAYEIGANRIKVQSTETERLRFEQWMAGHCWKVGGTWDGSTYRGLAERGDYLDPQAMHTRQLFAAWRDCAALRDQLEASQASVSNGTLASQPPFQTEAGAARQLEEIALLVRVLVRALRRSEPSNEHAAKALDYLKRHGLQGNPLRELPAGGDGHS